MIDRFTGEFAFLSNFYSARIFYAGMSWATTEHAYQAMKSLDMQYRNRIRLAAGAGRAKRLGRGAKLRDDWENIKIGVMEEIVRRKFQEHPALAQRLLQTGEAELVEGNTWGDTFWGVCRGVGDNHLGKILMKVREELRGN